MIEEQYSKLFRSITTSTVWMQPDAVRLVWITMLAVKDKSGIVWASLPGLAHLARVSLEGASQAIEVLSAPDPYSRTPDFEGRRIESIEGGWRVLNHAKYRAVRDPEVRAEQNREAQARYKAAHKKVSQGKPESAHTDTDTEKRKTNTAHPKTAAPCISSSLGFRTFWEAYPLKKGKGQALKAWNKLKPSDELVAMIVSAIATQTRERQSLHDAGEFVPEWKYPATWLFGECWLDETRQPAAKTERRSFEGML